MVALLRRYVCGVCGRKITADQSVYSKFTRARYCADLRRCDNRKRRAR
jgi:hypothetical protein